MNKTLTRWLTCALLVLLAMGVQAQENAQDFSLGPEDIIEVFVLNHIDLNRTLTILPDGNISFPEVGEIKAAGKTPKQLAAQLKEGLEKTRNLVDVTVSVKELKSRKIRILGAVKTAGEVALKPNFRLMDAIALAGGLTAKPIRVSGKLIRDRSTIIPINIELAMAKPESDANPVLLREDLILLEELDITKQVSVLGQVAKPGTLDLTEGLTIVQALSQVGGWTDKAALGQSYVMRGSEKIPLNLVPTLLQNKTDESVANFQFKIGDVLMIPEATLRFGVLGQVMKPAYYPLPERQPITVVEALSIAGGPTEFGYMRKAGILRWVDGKQTTLPIDFDEILKKGKLAKNVVVQDGDILYIPSRSRREFGIQDVLSPIAQILSFGLLR